MDNILHRQGDSDVDDWTVGENGELIKEVKSPYCPIRPCACCPNYILASGGECGLVLYYCIYRSAIFQSLELF